MNYEIRQHYGTREEYKVLSNIVLPLEIQLKRNEELDMAHIIIQDVNYKRRIPKNTRIEIVETESNTKYQFVVAYDNVKLTKQNFPANAQTSLYTHDVTLIESIALLEQIQLSNLMFSKDINNINNSSILNILTRLINIVNHTIINDQRQLYELSPNLIEILNQDIYKIPTEFFFQDLNLLEILREIGNKINAIPRLVDYKYIDYYFVNSGENVWEEDSEYSYYENSQIPNEYNSDLVSFGKNIVSGSDTTNEGYLIYPYSGGYVALNSISNDTLRIANDSAVFYCGGEKIYEIRHLFVKNVNIANPEQSYEITKYIYERHQYNILEDTETGKGLALTYDQYGTYIYGLDNQPIRGFIPPFTAMKNILSDLGISSSNQQTNFKQIQYQIEFRTVFDNVEISERNNNNDFPYSSQLLFNQTNNLLSSQSFSSFKSAKQNKLGNISNIKSYIFDNIAEIPNVGDLVNNSQYYVNDITLQLYQDAILCDIEFTKDFNKISEFISVNSRKRPFPIPVDEFVSNRHINLKEYIKLSLNPFEETSLNNSTTYPSHITPFFMANLFYPLVNVTEYEFNRKCYSASISTFYNNEKLQYPTQSSLIIPVNSYVGSSNSLCYSWKMRDNVVAGNSSIEGSPTNSSYPITYTDKGNVEEINYGLLSHIELEGREVPFNLPKYQGSLFGANPYLLFNAIGDATTIDEPTMRLKVYKDIREILNLTTQITFVVDNEPIFFKKEFLNRNVTVDDTYIYSQPKLYCLKNRKLGEYEIVVPIDAEEISLLSPPTTYVENGCQVLSVITTPTDCQSWFLAYETGEIVIGCHSRLNNENKIFAKKMTIRNSSIDPQLALSLTVYLTDNHTNQLQSMVDFNRDSDGYQYVDFGDGTNQIGNRLNLNHYYNGTNVYYTAKIYSNDLTYFQADAETGVHNLIITNIQFNSPKLKKLMLNNNSRRIQNVYISNLNIENMSELEYLDISLVNELKTIQINNNNNLKVVDISNCGFINNEDMIMKIVSNLQKNTSSDDYIFYASGISNENMRKRISDSVTLKGWKFET